MAKVLVVVPTSKNDIVIKVRITAIVLADKFNEHSITDNPEEADVILIFGSHRAYFEDLRKHELIKKYRDKVFIVHCGDKFIPFIPGIYTSVEKRWYSKSRMRSYGYYGIKDHEYFYYDDDYSKQEYLYSFIGASSTNKIRKQILSLKHPNGYMFDTAKDQMRFDARKDPAIKEQYKLRYASVMRKSKFVLCPRGFGTSSFRLFESMLFGRVPIIISDQWLPVEGPNWELFSLSVREKDWKNIPDILKTYENRSTEMGKAARKEWEKWFATNVIFHRLVNLSLEIISDRNYSERYERIFPFFQMLRPFHLIRYPKKKLEYFLNGNAIDEKFEVIEYEEEKTEL